MSERQSSKQSSPFAHLSLTPHGKRSLVLLAFLSAGKAAALVMLAEAVARGIVSAGAGTDAGKNALVLGIVAAIARGGISWATDVTAARAALGAKESLRHQLAERVLVRGGRDVPQGVGAITSLATRGLDDLDSYFTQYLPALVSSATIPLLIGARILWADWVSALIITLTIPLIPIFMTLIGSHTQERVTDAADSLARLSDHLVELARGLPVLVGLGRAGEQAKALRDVSERYRTKTMTTLRVAFLSSLALEMLATISVAVVAVFIGVRLVHGEISLEIGLLALILAPECYLPFREVGAAHHASENGIEALKRARQMIQSPVSRTAFVTQEPGSRGRVVVRDLSVQYGDRAQPAVAGLSFVAEAGQIVALTGASGAGKSTVLAAIAGLLGNTSGESPAQVTGEIAGIDPQRLAWVSQHPMTYAETVGEEIRLSCGPGREGDVMDVLRRVAADHLVDRHPGELSPGELRRVAFGRALARVNAGATVLLLDEPTAHLDADTADAIAQLIDQLRGQVTIIMVAHDTHLRRLGDVLVPVGGEPGAVLAEVEEDSTWIRTTRSGLAHDAFPASGPAVSSFGRSDRHETDPYRVEETPEAQTTSEVLKTLVNVVQPWRMRFLLAVLFGVLAALAAVALTSVSGWLIVRASQQPPILYLLVAIVGVRFFGIGRALFRYMERLWLHDAIFASLTDLRVNIWIPLAAQGPSVRRLLRGEQAIDHLIGDVERVRDLTPRVVLPPMVAAITAIVSIVALGLLLPAAAWVMVACSAVALGAAPLVALWADRSASAGEMLIRSDVLRRFASLFGAAADLRVNGTDQRVLAEISALDSYASTVARRSAWALGLGNGIVTLASCLTSIAMIAVSVPAIQAGKISPEIVAVLVLTPLALIDPFLGAVTAVQQWPALRTVLGRFAGVTVSSNVATNGLLLPQVEHHSVPSSRPERSGVERSLNVARDDERIQTLEIEGLAAGWPGDTEPVFADLAAHVKRGEWLVVTGPSGSGKSTLLAVLLGFLRPDAGTYLLNGRDTMTMTGDEIRQRIAWCPQEAHLFDSSLRANLLLARSREDAPSIEELNEVLTRVGLGELLAGLPDGLETRIGPQGSFLSGGQRQRVAVARTLLTKADVLLIDEPTAHLDRETADALMNDLRAGLQDKIVIMVTHDRRDILPGDERIELGRSARVLAEAW